MNFYWHLWSAKSPSQKKFYFLINMFHGIKPNCCWCWYFHLKLKCWNRNVTKTMHNAYLTDCDDWNGVKMVSSPPFFELFIWYFMKHLVKSKKNKLTFLWKTLLYLFFWFIFPFWIICLSLGPPSSPSTCSEVTEKQCPM